MLPHDPLAFPDNRFFHDDRFVDVDALVASPRLAVLSGLLSIDECEAVIEAARAVMTPSLVIDDDNVGSAAHHTRTSSSMHFPPGGSSVADTIQRRIMSVVGLPVAHAEPLQVLRYGPGEEYAPHFDYFDADQPGEATDSVRSTVARFGQRIATVICYLSAVDAGGGTVFPQAGIEVRPSPGRALYFTYVDVDGSVDPMSLHAGAPVELGEKWIATQWIRERPYREGT